MRKTLRSSSQELFLDLLKRARKEAGLTQAAVAKKLRKPQSFVAKYEHGERRIDVVEFVAIARVLQADPIDLLTKFLDKEETAAQTAPRKSARPRGGK
jgi:transcriptional regulator with XRE-family HTH domain